MSVADSLTYAGWSAAWAVVQRLPERTALGLFERAGDLAWRRQGKRVRRLESNLARVLPDASPDRIRQVSHAGMRSYLRYWCEIFRLHTLSKAQILDRVVTHNEDRLWKPMRDGQGVVAALPHMANWDLAAAWVGASGGSLTTVAERLRPDRLFERFVAYREFVGAEVLPLTGGENPFDTLAARVRDGRLVCLVADRDLSERGVEVSFFGATARMPAGPAALAVRAKAVLVPVTLWYEGPRMHIHFHEAVTPRPGRGSAIADLTQQVADVFADGIAEHPEDWHMLQRLWVDDLEPRE